MVTFTEILTLDGRILLADIIRPILDGMAQITLKMMDMGLHRCLHGPNNRRSRLIHSTMVIQVRVPLHCPPSMEGPIQDHPDIRKLPHIWTQIMQAATTKGREVLQKVVGNVCCLLRSHHVLDVGSFWTIF
jgi:hypothetical protein